MKLKKDIAKDGIIIIVTIFLGILFINLVQEPTSEYIEEIPQPQSDNTNDFSSSKQGTFVGTINGNHVVNQEKIVLFRSSKVSGLSLVYYPQKKILTGGTPEMKVEEIVIFDNQIHQIAYTFKRYDKQKLYFDGNLVAESNFNSFPKHFTGLVTGYQDAYVSELFEDVRIG